MSVGFKVQTGFKTEFDRCRSRIFAIRHTLQIVDVKHIGGIFLALLVLSKGKGHIPHMGKIIKSAPSHNRQIIAAGRPTVGVQCDGLLNGCQITIRIAAQHKSHPDMQRFILWVIYIKGNALIR